MREPVKVKKCPNCGKEIRTRNARKRYCCEFCQKRMAAIWRIRHDTEVMLGIDSSGNPVDGSQKEQDAS